MHNVRASVARTFPSLPGADRAVGIDGVGKRSPVVVGIEYGPADSPLNTAAREIAQAASTARREVARANAGVSRFAGERVDAVEGVARKAATAVREAVAKALPALETAINESRTATWALGAPHDVSTPFHVVTRHYQLAQRLAAMSPTERQGIVQRAVADPATASTLWTTVVLRVPSELTSVAPADRNRLRVASLKTFEPERAESIANLERQARLMVDTLKASISAVRAEHAQLGTDLALDPTIAGLMNKHLPAHFSQGD